MVFPRVAVLVAAVNAAAAVTLRAQQDIPIVKLGSGVVTSTVDIGQRARVRPTSDGHVIVDAGTRRRVYLLDSSLTLVTVVRDSGAGTSSAIGSTVRLIPYLGDSSLLADVETRAMSVLDERGRFVRSIAAPSGTDMLPMLLGNVAVDRSTRLLYIPRVSTSAAAPDSAPLVRGDFEARRVDTIAWLNVAPETRADFSVKMDRAGREVHAYSVVMNPFARGDEWAVLLDGSIAIVRVQDYHIDWIDRDGGVRATPRMPMDWRAYSDSERKAIVDSTRRQAEVNQERRQKAARGSSAAVTQRSEFSVIPESQFPTYWPAIRRGSVIADIENHLWILPTTSNNAANGPTYDVVDRDGRITRRVQIPKGRIVVGFGPGVVYMTRFDGVATYLERASIAY